MVPVRSPRLSARAVIYQDDTLLLNQHEDERGFWYVTPGGGILHGETLEEGLQREVFEELGASITIGPVLAIREVVSLPQDETYLPPDFHQVEVFFACTLQAFVQPATEMDPAQIGYEWVPLSELHDRLFFPEAFKDFLIDRQFPKLYFGVVR